MFCLDVTGQLSAGMSGGLTIPYAILPADGTMTAGGNYLPKAMLPSDFGYNSGNYFVRLTFLPFCEIGYRCTLLRTRDSKDHLKWNKDRSISLQLCLLKERKWWPSISIGSNDIITTNRVGEVFKRSGGNRYFATLFGVIGKDLNWQNNRLRGTIGYCSSLRKDSSESGVLCGIEYVNKSVPWLFCMAELDRKAFNLGFRCCLWNKLSFHVICYDFRNVSGGCSYSINLFGKNGTD